MCGSMYVTRGRRVQREIFSLNLSASAVASACDAQNDRWNRDASSTSSDAVVFLARGDELRIREEIDAKNPSSSPSSSSLARVALFTTVCSSSYRDSLKTRSATTLPSSGSTNIPMYARRSAPSSKIFLRLAISTGFSNATRSNVVLFQTNRCFTGSSVSCQSGSLRIQASGPSQLSRGAATNAPPSSTRPRASTGRPNLSISCPSPFRIGADRPAGAVEGAAASSTASGASSSSENAAGSAWSAGRSAGSASGPG
mmetsp:Transcript_17500/g.53816  ORF Transcript_17500/g.53816 Transcript_17500/m.53816 type:complete len:256 (-) Transcript_17500:181-948(-)